MNTPDTGIVLFAHGSRDPLWRLPIDAVAQAMASASPGCVVRCAFLELTAPDLLTTVSELSHMGLKAVRIVPMFLGVGRHARKDLPELVQQLRQQHPQLTIELMPPVGEHPAMTRLMAHIALGALPNP